MTLARLPGCLRNRDVSHGIPSGRSRYLRWTWLAVFLALVGIAERAPAQSLSSERAAAPERPPVDATRTPDSQPSRQSSDVTALPPASQALISATLGKDQPAYHAVSQPDGFRMENSNHGVSALFTRAGVDFQQGAGRWGMVLRGYGYGDTLRPAAPSAPHAEANRLEYRRNALTEWYLNGPLGLEQGFTIDQAPGKSDGEPLTLAFTLTGDLTPSIDPGARGLTLNKGRAATLRYGGLIAADATGRELRSWLEISEKTLRIRVDDSAARYPVSIDPMVQAVKLTNNVSLCEIIGGACQGGEAGDKFGQSVSISSDGNTLVVGAPHARTNADGGAAYVFRKPNLGWGGCITVGCSDYVAKLTPSSGSPGFGEAVAISGDGNTIAVLLATQSDFGAGLVYVFVKPSTGWASTTQTALLSLHGPVEGPCRDGLNPAYCSAVFPSSVAINGDGSTVLLGYTGGVVGTEARGAVYVFVRPATGWANSFIQTAKLIASDGNDRALLGFKVSISSDDSTIAAAAPQQNGLAGAVYVFTKFGTGWTNATQTAKLTNAIGFLGNSVDISGNGDTVVAGAAGKGDVFVEPIFELCIPGGGCIGFPAWVNTTPTAELSGSDGPIGILRISGDGATVAAAGLDSLFGGVGPGAVYLYARPATGWASATESAKATALDSVAGDRFGNSISLANAGTIMAVGAPGATIGSNVDQGAAYVFTGSPTAPKASVAPSSLTFGSQPVGTTSGTQQVTVTNTGTAPLTVTSVSVTGPFTTTQNCVAASPVGPGNSCSEDVAFAPSSPGAVTGTLIFTDNSGGIAGATQQVPLSGTGVKADTSTAIGSVSPNPALAGQTVTVTFSVAPQGANTLTPSGTVTVLASTGESCTGNAPSGSCTLAFATAGTRTITATYNGDVNFNPSTSPAVSEQIVDFALSVFPSSQAINGKRANYGVTVTAQNGFAGTVALSCSGGPAGTTCTVTPASVTLSGGTAAALIRLSLPQGPSANGTYTVTVTGTSGGTTRQATATLIVN